MVNSRFVPTPAAASRERNQGTTDATSVVAGGGAVVLVVAAFGAAKVTGRLTRPTRRRHPSRCSNSRRARWCGPVLAGLPLTLEFSGALVAPAPRCCAPRRPVRSSNSRLPKAAGFAPARCLAASISPMSTAASPSAPRRWSRRAPSSCRPNACRPPTSAWPTSSSSRPTRSMPRAPRSTPARAGLDAAQAQLTTARLARRDGTLLAPIGGWCPSAMRCRARSWPSSSRC